jgi:GC-rich sequence DNA-binding factor
VKKSNLSKKLTLATHSAYVHVQSTVKSGLFTRVISNALPVSLDQATITPRSNGTPVYDQAYLSELKASTPTSRRVAPVAESYVEDVSMDLGEISVEATETSCKSPPKCLVHRLMLRSQC